MEKQITPQSIVEWLKSRAKKYHEMANAIEQDFAQSGAGMTRYPRRGRTVASSQNGGSITADQLIARVKKKSARINRVAAEFNVEPEAIAKLLEPASPVYCA